MPFKKIAALTILLLLSKISTHAHAQDTLTLTLEQAEATALAQNLSMRAAEAGIKQARRAEQEKWGALLPTLDASGTYSRYLQKPVIFLPEGSPMGSVLEIGSDNSYQGGIQAKLPLVAMPVYRGIQMGKIDREIARETARGSRLNILGDVRLAYLNVLLAHDSYDVMEESMRRAEVTLNNVENLHKQGVVSEYDLLRANVQVSNLRPMYIQARQGVEIAELSLKALLGIPEETRIKLVGSLQLLAQKFTPDTAQQRDATNNSDLRLLELQEKKLSKQHQMLRDSRWPMLAAFANFQVQTQANNFNFSEYQWVQTSIIGLQLNVPLFTGLTKWRQEQQLRIAAERLSLQRSYAEQQMGIRIQMAEQQMQAAQESMEANEAGLKMALRGRDIAEIRYNTGAGTLLELNDAEMALTQASLGYNQAVYNYAKAYIEYVKASGQE